MARLSQLAGNLRIVFPPTVTIAVLFTLFQQSLSQFNFTTQFFRTGTEQHPVQFFYLSPQMFYFPFIFFDLFFGTCQCRAQEGLRLFNQTQLLVFLTELAFQFCNANEVFLTHGRFYNAARRFGYLAVTYRRPDKLAFLQAFGEQAQTISISPKNFNGVTPSATEDKQVTGEGIIIQHMLYLFSQSVEGFTHIGNAGNEPDTGT